MGMLDSRLRKIELKLHPPGSVIWPYLSMLRQEEWCRLLPISYYGTGAPPERIFSPDAMAVLSKFSLRTPYQLGEVICNPDTDNTKRVNIYPYHPYQNEYWAIYTETLKRNGKLPDERRWRSPYGNTMKDKRFGPYHLSDQEQESLPSAREQA